MNSTKRRSIIAVVLAMVMAFAVSPVSQAFANGLDRDAAKTYVEGLPTTVEYDLHHEYSDADGSGWEYVKTVALGRIDYAESDTELENAKTYAETEINKLVNVNKVAEAIVDACADYDASEYSVSNYDWIQWYCHEAIVKFNKDLSLDDANAIKTDALAKMSGVKKLQSGGGTVLDKTSYKNLIDNLVDSFKRTELYKASALTYSNAYQGKESKIDDLATEYKGKIDVANYQSEIENKYSEFRAKLLNIDTIVDFAYVEINYDREMADTRVYTDDDYLAIATEALTAYHNSLNPEPYAPALVTAVMGNQSVKDNAENLFALYKSVSISKLVSLSDGLVKRDYSDATLSLVAKRLSDDKAEIGAKQNTHISFLEKINEIVKNFKDYLDGLEKMSSSLKTKTDDSYKLTINAKRVSSGEPACVFEPEAWIRVSEYYNSSVRKNLNSEVFKSYNGIRTLYYLDVTVDLTDTEYDFYSTRKDTDHYDDVTYEIVLSYEELDKIDKFGDGLEVVFYKGNGEIEVLSSEIDTETKTITFYTTHMGAFAVCGKNAEMKGFSAFVFRLGFYDGKTLINPFFYIAIILAILLICLIVKLSQNSLRYYLTFNTMGGNKIKASSARKGEYWLTPATPVKEGYVFSGWFYDKKCKKRFIDYLCVKGKNVKVYAKWVQRNAYVDSLPDYFKALKASILTYVAPAGGVLGSKKDDLLLIRLVLKADRIHIYLAGKEDLLTTRGHKLTAVEDSAFKTTVSRFTVNGDTSFREGLAIIRQLLVSYGYTKGGYEDDGRTVITEEDKAYGFSFYAASDRNTEFAEKAFSELRTLARSYDITDLQIAKLIDGQALAMAYKEINGVDLYLATRTDRNGFEDVSGDPKYAEVPAHIMVNDTVTLELAKQVLTEVMTNFKLTYVGKSKNMSDDSKDSFCFRISVEYEDEEE